MKTQSHQDVHVPAGQGRVVESLAERAHELWLSCGEPVVRDDSIWQEAERELRMEQSERVRTTVNRRR